MDTILYPETFFPKFRNIVTRTGVQLARVCPGWIRETEAPLDESTNRVLCRERLDTKPGGRRSLADAKRETQTKKGLNNLVQSAIDGSRFRDPHLRTADQYVLAAQESANQAV